MTKFIIQIAEAADMGATLEVPAPIVESVIKALVAGGINVERRTTTDGAICVINTDMAGMEKLNGILSAMSEENEDEAKAEAEVEAESESPAEQQESAEEEVAAE